MLTAEQIANKLGVEKVTAYGFLKLLTELGLVETGRAKAIPGKKGKPSTLYNVTEDVLQNFVSTFFHKVIMVDDDVVSEAEVVAAPEVVSEPEEEKFPEVPGSF